MESMEVIGNLIIHFPFITSAAQFTHVNKDNISFIPFSPKIVLSLWVFLAPKIAMYSVRSAYRQMAIWTDWHILFNEWNTGCSLNIVFFFKDFRIFRTLGFLCLPVLLCVHKTRKVEHQRCSRTGRVQKNHNILRKKYNI